MNILATSGGFRPARRTWLEAGPIVEFAFELARGSGAAEALLRRHRGRRQPALHRRRLPGLPRPGRAGVGAGRVPDAQRRRRRGRTCSAQDVVWVGGGSVAGLLALWRLHGWDGSSAEAWEAGVVLGGVSAGSLCWHIGGTTDSFGPQLRPVTNGLALLPYSNGVHYDSEEQRRPLYHRLIADGALPAGYADRRRRRACTTAAPSWSRPSPTARTCPPTGSSAGPTAGRSRTSSSRAGSSARLTPAEVITPPVTASPLSTPGPVRRRASRRSRPGPRRPRARRPGTARRPAGLAGRAVSLGRGVASAAWMWSGQAWSRTTRPGASNSRCTPRARPAPRTPCCCWSTRRSTPRASGPRRGSGRPDGTPVVDVDRGGRITWHGPGQLIGYPILALADPVDVVAYVRRARAGRSSTSAPSSGLATDRVEGRSGVWMPRRRPDRRSRAIGIRVVARGDDARLRAQLRPRPDGYDRIVPCGIADAG